MPAHHCAGIVRRRPQEAADSDQLGGPGVALCDRRLRCAVLRPINGNGVLRRVLNAASLVAWMHDEIIPAIPSETAMIRTVVLQAGWAAMYYFGVVAVVRIAGKRLAGQTGTFDLVC